MNMITAIPRLELWGLVLIVLASGLTAPARAGDGAEGDQGPRPVKTAEAARAAFRSQIGPVLEKSFSGETLQRWRDWIGADDEKKWDIRRQQFSEAFKRIDGTLTAREKASGSYYLLGKPVDLRREGQCWEVGHLGNGLVGITGYSEAETGALVFVWLLPEG